MFNQPFRSIKTTPSQTKREFYKQDFHVHHPLLEQIISAKLEKCLKYGQVRDKVNTFNKIPR